MEQNKKINIMTSCDENLAKQLPVLLQSIADNIFNRSVHFYLFHSAVKSETVSLLKKLCEHYQTIVFHEVPVPNPEDYVMLAKRGGGWNGEAYYSLCAHQLLPDDVDRIMYLDAGDVIVTGMIDEYYFDDFEEKALIATAACFKPYKGQPKLFESEDMAEREFLKRILRGLFNSGSYVINLDRMRMDGYTMVDFLYLSDRLAEVMGTEENVYFGDQGLIAAAFAGNIKFFRYPQIADVWYMPYNFCLWYFNKGAQKPNYKTNVIHYAGADFKPWKGKYPTYLPNFQKETELIELDGLKAGQAEYYYLWYEYALRAQNVINQMEH